MGCKTKTNCDKGWISSSKLTVATNATAKIDDFEAYPKQKRHYRRNGGK
jgi:hypothetical protein